VQEIGAYSHGGRHACEKTALIGAVEAAEKNLIQPILVGPAAKIEALTKAAGIDPGNLQIMDVPHSHASGALVAHAKRQGEGRES
jgi:phosphate acetyltransferase